MRDRRSAQVRVVPPEQVAHLYIGPLDNPPPLSIVDLEAPDLTRFPHFAKALATAQIAELGPGEALFIPRHWWHHVTSRDAYNAMINFWWGTRVQGLENPTLFSRGVAVHQRPSRARAELLASHVQYLHFPIRRQCRRAHSS